MIYLEKHLSDVDLSVLRMFQYKHHIAKAETSVLFDLLVISLVQKTDLSEIVRPMVYAHDRYHVHV